MPDLRDCMGPGELDQAALNVMNLLAYCLLPEERKAAPTPSPQSSPLWGEEVYGDVPRVPEGLIGVGGG